jgi:type IX secretion system PorP/SprF family membrane protein
MKSTGQIVVAVLAICFSAQYAIAQGIHFSQFYNAPMLANPANTALMSESDYRLGINYREQWAAIPVPYKSFSGFAELQAFHSKELESNWLGIGFAFFNDKAGDGNLSLSNMQLSTAYHMQLGMISMLSAGLYGGYVQRSVDFSKFYFDAQWNGLQFDPDNRPSNETNKNQKTNFYDAGAGINFAYFPNEHVYLKIGGSVAHMNQPTESFYQMDNKIGIRPTFNADAILNLNNAFTLNPSVYLTYQKGAKEILYGTQLYIFVGGKKNIRTNLIVGGFHRLNEAVVGSFGIEWANLKLTFSYDYTMSKLAPDNKGQGAAEFSIIYLGNYLKMGRPPRNANCPRF